MLDGIVMPGGAFKTPKMPEHSALGRRNSRPKMRAKSIDIETPVSVSESSTDGNALPFDPIKDIIVSESADSKGFGSTNADSKKNAILSAAAAECRISKKSKSPVKLTVQVNLPTSEFSARPKSMSNGAASTAAMVTATSEDVKTSPLRSSKSDVSKPANSKVLVAEKIAHLKFITLVLEIHELSMRGNGITGTKTDDGLSDMDILNRAFNHCAKTNLNFADTYAAKLRRDFYVYKAIYESEDFQLFTEVMEWLPDTISEKWEEYSYTDSDGEEFIGQRLVGIKQIVNSTRSQLIDKISWALLNEYDMSTTEIKGVVEKSLKDIMPEIDLDENQIRKNKFFQMLVVVLVNIVEQLRNNTFAASSAINNINKSSSDKHKAVLEMRAVYNFEEQFIRVLQRLDGATNHFSKLFVKEQLKRKIEVINGGAHIFLVLMLIGMSILFAPVPAVVGTLVGTGFIILGVFSFINAVAAGYFMWRLKVADNLKVLDVVSRAMALALPSLCVTLCAVGVAIGMLFPDIIFPIILLNPLMVLVPLLLTLAVTISALVHDIYAYKLDKYQGNKDNLYSSIANLGITLGVSSIAVICLLGFTVNPIMGVLVGGVICVTSIAFEFFSKGILASWLKATIYGTSGILERFLRKMEPQQEAAYAPSSDMSLKSRARQSSRSCSDNLSAEVSDSRSPRSSLSVSRSCVNLIGELEPHTPESVFNSLKKTVKTLSDGELIIAQRKVGGIFDQLVDDPGIDNNESQEFSGKQSLSSGRSEE